MKALLLFRWRVSFQGSKSYSFLSECDMLQKSSLSHMLSFPETFQNIYCMCEWEWTSNSSKKSAPANFPPQDQVTFQSTNIYCTVFRKSFRLWMEALAWQGEARKTIRPSDGSCFRMVRANQSPNTLSLWFAMYFESTTTHSAVAQEGGLDWLSGNWEGSWFDSQSSPLFVIVISKSVPLHQRIGRTFFPCC